MIAEGRTERLLLKPLERADAVQIQAVFPQWEIVQYLAAVVPWPYPADGAEQYVAATLATMNEGEGWCWTIRNLMDPARVIGCIELRRGDNENRGFWLDPAFRGRGLMTEACNWVTEFWFETLGFERLRAPKAAANIASRRISERQGMRLVARGEKDYVCGRLASETWEITREEWRARKR